MAGKTSIRPCPVCLGRAVNVLHHQRFMVPADYPLPSALDIVACEACDMVFSDTPATQAQYDAYYERFSVYEDVKTSSGGGVSATDAERLGTVADCLRDFVANKDASIADVGCANGFLLGQLKQRGFRRLLGIDPSAACVAHTRELGVEAVQGSLTRIPAEVQNLDVIILSHVLEHVRDVRETVASVVTHLADDGRLYVEVPNAARYKDFVVAPFQDFNTEHINHFGAAAIDNLLHALGFEREMHGAKVFESSPKNPFPAVFGVWRRKGSASKRDLARDGLGPAIGEYISRSRDMMTAMSATITQTLARTPTVVVWGTGQLAMKLLLDSPLATANIAALIDSNTINHGKVIRGVTVRPPAALVGLPYPVIVTSTIHHAAIARAIRDELKLPNDIVSLQLATKAL